MKGATWVLILAFYGGASFAKKFPAETKTLGELKGQTILSFASKFDFDCVKITDETVKKLKAKTRCTKQTWADAVKDAPAYFECRVSGVSVYVADTPANCAQMKDWLQAQ